MKRVLHSCFALLIAISLSLSACTDKSAVVDQNTEIVNNNWAYFNKIKVSVKITDASIRYNLYLNLRVTADYKYSNLFTIIRQIGPDKKVFGNRYEFKLADKDGAWLGDGSGNIYSYQIPFLSNYKFTA